MAVLDTIIWGGVLLGFIYIIYDFFLKSKGFCKIIIIEKSGGSWVPHMKKYKGVIKKTKNRKDITTVRWLEISGIKRMWKVPTLKELYRDNKGNRILYLAWYGGNNFTPLKFNDKRFKVVEKKDGGKFIVKKMPQAEMMILTDKMKMYSRVMDDDLNYLYNKESFLETYKAYLAFALFAMFCIGALYLTTTAMDKNTEKSANIFKTAVESFTQEKEKQVDGATVINKEGDS